GDAVQAEADWAADASPVVPDPAQWVGRVATRALAAGQPIRQAMVRTQQVLQAGASVRILAGGRGFEVSTEGQALSAGGVGEAVRVRMPNGRIATGQVVDAGTVRMAL
ncbi:flagellar basal body P-ring formation chaperone FlgA, partial [Pseudacidovorax intermedius]|uniref:flagellar basal body P-ring formation chaperone FlgA n=1 Tax=Pseudacidovorax intermedius TaxID=433924 RepID=UPI0005C29DCD